MPKKKRADTVREPDITDAPAEKQSAMAELAVEVAPPGMIPAKTRRSTVNVPPRFKVDTGHMDASRAAAQKIIEAKQRLREEQTVKYKPDDLHYIECTNSNCLGPAIWLWGDPTRQLTPDDWEASYKPRGAHWPGSQAPFCQCCWEANKSKIHVRAFHSADPENPAFTPNARFVRVAEDDLRAMLTGNKE